MAFNDPGAPPKFVPVLAWDSDSRKNEAPCDGRNYIVSRAGCRKSTRATSPTFDPRRTRHRSRPESAMEVPPGAQIVWDRGYTREKELKKNQERKKGLGHKVDWNNFLERQYSWWNKKKQHLNDFRKVRNKVSCWKEFGEYGYASPTHPEKKEYNTPRSRIPQARSPDPWRELPQDLPTPRQFPSPRSLSRNEPWEPDMTIKVPPRPDSHWQEHPQFTPRNPYVCRHTPRVVSANVFESRYR